MTPDEIISHARAKGRQDAQDFLENKLPYELARYLRDEQPKFIQDKLFRLGLWLQEQDKNLDLFASGNDRVRSAIGPSLIVMDLPRLQRYITELYKVHHVMNGLRVMLGEEEE